MTPCISDVMAACPDQPGAEKLAARGEFLVRLRAWHGLVRRRGRLLSMEEIDDATAQARLPVYGTTEGSPAMT